MKKIVFVIIILILVLLFFWWARNTKFNLIPLATSLSREKNASTSGMPTINTPTTIPVEIIITITPNGFVPDSLMINKGTKITWVNKSGLTANISSYPESAFPALNLGDIWENSSVSLTFTTPGRYHYLNGKNALQKGTLIVR